MHTYIHTYIHICIHTYHKWQAIDALARYAWDSSVTLDVGNLFSTPMSGPVTQTNFDLTNINATLAPSSECRDMSCAYFRLGATPAYLRLPPYNFGQHTGLTISARIHPLAGEAGLWSRVMDFGNGPSNGNIVIARELSSSRITVAVYRTGLSPASMAWISRPGAWIPSEWRHVVWTLNPIDGTGWFCPCGILNSFVSFFRYHSSLKSTREQHGQVHGTYSLPLALKAFACRLHTCNHFEDWNNWASGISSGAMRINI
jgi:hypothetical protein